jgi:hypothetical protein
LSDEASTNERYELTVLTVMTNAEGVDVRETAKFDPKRARAQFAETGGHRGLLGHALLHYPKSGGKLLTSAGHWMELSQLKTNESNVFNAMKKQVYTCS